MNLFGIGTSEFIIILILALIFLGPQRLPEYANKLGQKIREWRMMSQVFMVEWKEELAALEEARQSLAEARSALLEAQRTVTSEVKEVSETVSTEMESAQKDISAQLSEAGKAVSDETAQVRKTMAKAKQGKLDVDTTDKVAGTVAAESPVIGSSEPTGDVAGEDPTTKIDSNPADVDASDVADVSDVSDVDISDIEELDEDDVSAMVENTIAPPALTQPTQMSQATELDEIAVAEVQTVSDVASAVAEKIATEVATQVTRKIVKNMTSDMAEEVAALVMARLGEAGINGNAVADDGEHSEDVADTKETLGSIQ